MPEPMGLTQFFAMEASDYLERLDGAVSKTPEPDRDEFVRFTRALRGSALMANQQAFAAAASGLERLARGVHDRSRPWDAATKQLAVRAVDDLKVLIRKASTWSDADTQKANQIAATLQAATGGAPPPSPKAATPGQRAIIAQQGAGLASALDQAATALQHSPQSPGPIQTVLKTMQPLRGIAGLADHPPLPDLLDGIDRAIAELVSRKEGTAPAADLFRSAARAVSRAAQDIGAKGQADPDASEAQDFARRLGGLLGMAGEVVSIDSLFFNDAGPHIVTQGVAPARPAKLGDLELVSHGEHLRQAADTLERASCSVQRELRVHALVGTFHSLASAGSGPLGAALAALARAAQEAIVRGAAVRDTQGFARQLREAGTVLSAAATETEASLAPRLAAVTALGAPVIGVIAFEIAFTIANLIEHGDIDLPLGLERRLSNILVTPALHRYHHSHTRSELDTNFGTISTWWDKSLRSFHPSASNVRVVTGLDESGLSCVLFDDAGGIVGGEGLTTILLWQSDEAPASNEGSEDGAREPVSFNFPPGGSGIDTARVTIRSATVSLSWFGLRQRSSLVTTRPSGE